MENFQFQKAEKDFTMVIFGASGDLAKLKIFPSLYQLMVERRLPVNFHIVGYGRTHFTKQQFQKIFEDAVVKKYGKEVDREVLREVLNAVQYIQGDYSKKEDYENLLAQLGHLKKHKDHVDIAYLSVPPQVFQPILENLGELKFEGRLVIEKPVGTDYSSAKALKKILRNNFEDEQIFLLDHYLGKEAVFNVLSLRYANAMLARLIQGKYIKNIQINGLETLGIEGRPSYDKVGNLRDMIQSHLFQILAFLTMNLPEEINTDTIHREKENLIKYIKIKDVQKTVVRGQYKSYTSESEIPKDSKTETFMAMRLTLDHLDWHDIPIYLRSGKKLAKQLTSIVIEFKPLPLHRKNDKIEPNLLVIQLQPEEKIEFHLLTKMGGNETDFHNLATSKTIYCAGDCIDPHGRLILETIRGSRLLFLCFEEVLSSWKVLEPVLEEFKDDKTPLHIYEEGTLGPKGVDDWIAQFGDKWNNF